MADEKVETVENEDGLLDESQQQEQKVDEGAAKKPTATDELRSAMTELAGTVKSIAEAKDKKEEPEITEEQKKAFWRVYDPESTRKDFFQKWFRMNPDATPEEVKDAKEMFADVQKGLVTQAVTGSMNLVEDKLTEFKESLKPLFDYMTERKSKETRESFNDAYPALADKKYEKIVTLVSKQLSQKDFKTDEEYFKALAESAAETIKAAGVDDFDLGAKPEKKPAATTLRLPRSSAGGTGGAGGGTQKETKASGDGTDDLL